VPLLLTVWEQRLEAEQSRMSVRETAVTKKADDQRAALRRREQVFNVSVRSSVHSRALCAQEEKARLDAEEKKLADELSKKRTGTRACRRCVFSFGQSLEIVYATELDKKRRDRLETIGHSDAPRLNTIRKPKAAGRRAPTPGARGGVHRERREYSTRLRCTHRSNAAGRQTEHKNNGTRLVQRAPSH
jgi:hypothetical protein